MFMHMNVSLTFEYILIANFLKNNFNYCKIKSIEIVTCRYFSLIFRGCPTEVRDNCRSYHPLFSHRTTWLCDFEKVNVLLLYGKHLSFLHIAFLITILFSKLRYYNQDDYFLPCTIVYMCNLLQHMMKF